MIWLRSKTTAVLAGCRFDADHLFVEFHTAEGDDFTLRIPPGRLVPLEPYPAPGIDLEAAIASAVAVLIDENAIHSKAGDLDGYTFPS